MNVQTFDDTTVVSDIHGYLDEFQAVLQRQKLLNENNRWIGGDSRRLILNGDFVDRGPKSVETYVFFRQLQKVLGPEQITMLFGNHDIQYFGGPECGVEGIIKTELSGIMKEDAKKGNLQAATTVKMGSADFLVVHGGLHPGHDLNKLGVQGAADHLNNLGRDFAENGVQHPEIVAIGIGRAPDLQRMIMHAVNDADISDVQRLLILNEPASLKKLEDLKADGKLSSDGEFVLQQAAMYGVSDTPGITWCDVVDDLGMQDPANLLPQVVGHRQQMNGINLRCGKKVWAVNVPYGDAQALTMDSSGLAKPSARWNKSFQGFDFDPTELDLDDPEMGI